MNHGSLRPDHRSLRERRPMRNLVLTILLSVHILGLGSSLALAQDTPLQNGLISDLNDDMRVDAKDLLILLNQWYSKPCEPTSEILYYYQVDGVTVSLTSSDSLIGIAFAESALVVDRSEFLGDYPVLSSFVDEVTSNLKIHRVAISNTLPIYDILNLLDELAKDQRIDFVTPVFLFPTSDALMDITFLTKFLPDISDEEIEDLNESIGVDIIESGRLIQNGGVFRLAPSRGGRFSLHTRNAVTTLQLANCYHELPQTEFSSPHFHHAIPSRNKKSGTQIDIINVTNSIDRTNSEIERQIPFSLNYVSDLNDDMWVDAEDLMLLLSGWRESRHQEEEPVRLFYYYGSNEIDLTASQTMIGVGFRATVSASDRMKFLEDHSSISSFVDAATVNQKVHRLTLENPLALNRLLDFLDSLAEDSRVEFVTPGFPFQFSDILLDRAFIVKFNPNVTEDQIITLNNTHGVQILRPGRLGQNGTNHLLAPSELGLYEYHWKNAVTSLLLANLYHENPLTEYSSPNYHFSNPFSSELQLRADSEGR